jgi:hypothetical protein
MQLDDEPAESGATPAAQYRGTLLPSEGLDTLADQIANRLLEPLAQRVADRIVGELQGDTQAISERPSIIAGILADLVPHFIATATQPASTSETLEGNELLQFLLSRIRDIVDAEGSRHQPVTAAYVGRALHELRAHDAASGQCRPDIFAFFARAESAGVLQNQEDYDVAVLCVRQQGRTGGRAASRVGPRPTPRATGGNRASGALETPINALERWRLISHVRDVNNKRQAAYLVDAVSRMVFNEWPDWPTPVVRRSTLAAQ